MSETIEDQLGILCSSRESFFCAQLNADLNDEFLTQRVIFRFLLL